MLQLYAILDKKTAAYAAPQFYKHVAEATRAIQNALESPNNQLAKWPHDFSLWLIGSFNPDGGQLYPTAEAGPQFVIEVASLVERKNNEQAN